jgi:hypothetical protein
LRCKIEAGRTGEIMFVDPFSNLMLVLLLFFCGLLVMFIFLMRNQESHWRNQEETRMQLALHLSDLEAKLDTLLRLVAAPGSVSGSAEDTDGLLDFPSAENAANPSDGKPFYGPAVASVWAVAQEYDAAATQTEEQLTDQSAERAQEQELSSSLLDFLDNDQVDGRAESRENFRRYGSKKY